MERKESPSVGRSKGMKTARVKGGKRSKMSRIKGNKRKAEIARTKWELFPSPRGEALLPRGGLTKEIFCARVDRTRRIKKVSTRQTKGRRNYNNLRILTLRAMVKKGRSSTYNAGRKGGYRGKGNTKKGEIGCNGEEKKKKH